MTPALWMGLIWMTAQPVAVGQDPRPERSAYVLAIGVNEPPAAALFEDLPTLQYADDDAVRFYQFFSRITPNAWLLAILDSETQQRYPGMADRARPPSSTQVDEVWKELSQRMAADRARGRETVLYLTYSGHGAVEPGGAGRLALQDGALTRNQLRQRLESFPADYIHLMIDACHAAAVVGVRGDLFGHESSAEVVALSPQELPGLLDPGLTARLPGLGLIAAATEGQESHEWSRIQSGIFSHELLSALSGAADVNGDGRIEYSEAAAFISSANRDLPDPRAGPQVVVLPPRRNQNVGLLDVRGLDGVVFLAGDPSSLGHFTIELSNGVRYLEANLGGLARTVLALPRETGVFLRTATEEAEVPLTDGDLQTLALSPRKDTGRGSLDQAYRRTLFASPYGVSYYLGYVDRHAGMGAQVNPLVVATREEPPPAFLRRPWAIAGWVLAGAALVTSIVTGALALDARADYYDTSLQRPSHEANDRYVRFGTAALGTGLGAVVFGLAGWWLWPAAQADPGVARVGWLGPRGWGLTWVW